MPEHVHEHVIKFTAEEASTVFWALDYRELALRNHGLVDDAEKCHKLRMRILRLIDDRGSEATTDANDS